MKRIVKLSVLLFLCMFINSCSTKSKFSNISTPIYFDNDSIDDYRNEKIENIVRSFVKKKYLNFDEEQVTTIDILDTKEKAEAFAKQIAVFNYPQCIDAINKYCKVVEDKTGKLWLVRIRLAESGLDTELTLLIVKNNCRILLKNNFL